MSWLGARVPRLMSSRLPCVQANTARRLVGPSSLLLPCAAARIPLTNFHAGRPVASVRGPTPPESPSAPERNSSGAPASSHRNERPTPPTQAIKSQLKSRLKPETAAAVEDICTVPNMLTIGRILLCPVIGWAVVTQQPYIAVGLLATAGFSDLLDGWIARQYKSKTMFGSIADPAADKILMTTMVGSLAYTGQMPLVLALLILGRDAFLTLMAFAVRWRSLPAPRTLQRYFDPRLPSVQVEPTRISKYNTFLQLLLVGVLTVYPCLPESVQTHPHSTRTLHVLMGIVGITTVWTGFDYAFSRTAVRYLRGK